MKRLGKILLMCCVPVIMFTSCKTRSAEVRDRAFIRCIGVEERENQEYVSIKIFGGDASEVYSGKGETVFSAIENAETMQSKNLFTGHIEQIIIGRGNLSEKLETMLSNNRITPACHVICTEENAEKIVKESDIPSTLSSCARKGTIMDRSISDILRGLKSECEMSVVPVIEGESLTMGIVSGNGIEKVLSDEESKGISWLNGRISDTVLALDRNTDFHIATSNVKIKTEVKQDDRLYIDFEVSVQAENSTGEKNNLAIEKIKDLCKSATDVCIYEYGCDSFGIENKLKLQQTKFFSEHKDNFREVLKNSVVRTEVKVN